MVDGVEVLIYFYFLPSDKEQVHLSMRPGMFSLVGESNAAFGLWRWLVISLVVPEDCPFGWRALPGIMGGERGLSRLGCS